VSANKPYNDVIDLAARSSQPQHLFQLHLLILYLHAQGFMTAANGKSAMCGEKGLHPRFACAMLGQSGQTSPYRLSLVSSQDSGIFKKVLPLGLESPSAGIVGWHFGNARIRGM